MRLFAVRDAIAHYERAKGLLHTEGRGQDGPPEGTTSRSMPTEPSLLHLLTQLGRAYEFVNNWEGARTVYGEMLELGFDCLAILAIIRVHGGKLHEGIAAAREGFTMAGEVSNPWGQANTGWVLGLGLLELGEHAQAIEVVEAGIAAARAAAIPPSLVFNLATLGVIYRSLFALGPALE